MARTACLFAVLTAATLAAAIVPLPQALAQQSEVIAELRSSLFETANAALNRANAAKANLLSPTNYATGAEYYRAAESTLSRGGNIESIRRDLDRAAKAFQEAAEQAGLAATTFETAIRARDDAISANAENYAADQWREAEVSFRDAAVRLEKGSLERAQKEGSEAELEFRAAELTAIKVNYLDETRTLLEKARDVRAPRYAPESYERATRLLEEATQALETNRYDTDEPRSLASAAKHQALHAIYVAGLERAIRSGDATLESILLDWEASITTLADLFDLAVYYDEGQQDAIERIRTDIQKLQADNTALNAKLEEREFQLQTLIQETASMERLSKLVARQERQQEKIAKVEALFTENEAMVLRQGDAVILRMVGLNFDTGSAVLKPEHTVLLGSLERAINEFPESNIVVEGHTDAFGSDTTNLVLSQKRAESVQQYLLDHTPVSPANLTALGYGESRPVANNETPEGRKRNRRIDVVIYPKW
ncbi:MAG: OmpA family protein [Pseudomonadales bacterium]